MKGEIDTKECGRAEVIKKRGGMREEEREVKGN